MGAVPELDPGLWGLSNASDVQGGLQTSSFFFLLLCRLLFAAVILLMIREIIYVAIALRWDLMRPWTCLFLFESAENEHITLETS
jgi:hypothetical protein